MIQGTYGVLIELSVGESLAGASSAQLIIVSPTGKRTIGSATVTDAGKGVVTHETQQYVFERDGDYQIQAWVTFPSKLLKSEVAILEVEKSL